MKWKAPELLLDLENIRQPTPAADVYSFGMVCYEMFSGEFPFQNIRDQMLFSALTQGKRPSRPEFTLSAKRGLNDAMWHLIEECWDQDPERRPEGKHVVQSIRQLLNHTVDKRQQGDFDPMSMSKMWYNLNQEHPFAALVPGPEDDDTLRRLKLASGG